VQSRALLCILPFVFFPVAVVYVPGIAHAFRCNSGSTEQKKSSGNEAVCGRFIAAAPSGLEKIQSSIIQNIAARRILHWGEPSNPARHWRNRHNCYQSAFQETNGRESKPL